MQRISLDNYKFSLILNNETLEYNDIVKKYETENSIIWIVNPNEESLNIFDLENLNNKRKFVHEVEGIGSCIIKDKKTKEFRAMSSINNELPWYYTTTKPYIIANNIFLIIKQLKSYDTNYNAIASYLSFDHTFGGETFLNQIKKVYGGDIIYLTNENIEIISNNLEKWLGFDNSINHPCTITDTFISEVNKSLRDPYPEIALTGGSDSRAILAGALLTNKKFTFMTGTAASVDKRDIKIAKSLARKLNIEHKTVDASKRKIGDIEKILDQITIETNAEFLPRNYIIFHKEYVMAQNTYNGVGRLKGYGGEIFKGFYDDVNKTIKKKTAILNQNYSDKVQSFITDIYMNYVNINKINSANLFYQRERSHFWVGSNIRASLSYCKIYNPLQQPQLLALGYRFEGGIEKSNLHYNMMQKLPEGIKNIPVNYSKIAFIIHRILNTKFIKKVDYNYFLHPDFLKKNINYELLEQLIPKQKIDILINIYATRGLYDDLLHKMFAVSNFFKLIG